MKMLYVLTHTCGEGGYRPVIFDNLYTAVSCMLDVVKVTLVYAINIEVSTLRSITMEYADDSFDEYNVFQVQQDTHNMELVPSFEEAYNLNGIQRLCEFLTVFPRLLEADTESYLKQYIDYLHQWSIDHNDKAFNGMFPAEYNEWLANELAENVSE